MVGPPGTSEEYNRTVQDLSVAMSVWLSEPLGFQRSVARQGGNHCRPKGPDIILQSTPAYVLQYLTTFNQVN